MPSVQLHLAFPNVALLHQFESQWGLNLRSCSRPGSTGPSTSRTLAEGLEISKIASADRQTSSIQVPTGPYTAKVRLIQ